MADDIKPDGIEDAVKNINAKIEEGFRSSAERQASLENKVESLRSAPPGKTYLDDDPEDDTYVSKKE